jgi:hypothetical protein
MRARTLRRMPVAAPRHARRRHAGAPDATIEPDPGPVPEAVFDRITGPYARRSALAVPGARELDEEM